MLTPVLQKTAYYAATRAPLKKQTEMLFQQKRHANLFHRFQISAPPQRHLTIWVIFKCRISFKKSRFQHHIGGTLLFSVGLLSYPTYVLLSNDNVKNEQFSEELQAELEERRQQRKEGKLNVLVQKV
jgi:hypothetical protein